MTHPRPEMPFVETSTFQVLTRTIERSHEFEWNALVTGAPGVGKTRAIDELIARSAGSHLNPAIEKIEVTAASGSSVMGLLEEYADLVGVWKVKSLAALEKKLRSQSAWQVKTVIFDEAQFLTLKAARTLLGISEATGMRMIFVGNPEVLKLVNSAQAAIQQISRRLPIREKIEFIDDLDADLIANTFGCEGMDAFRAIRDIARDHHADGIVNVLREAQNLAAAYGSKTVQLPHITAALDVFPQYRSSDRRTRRSA